MTRYIVPLDRSVASGTHSYRRYRKLSAHGWHDLFHTLKGRSAELSLRIWVVISPTCLWEMPDCVAALWEGEDKNILRWESGSISGF